MTQELKSAVFEGVVRHRRYQPHPHEFSYKMAQLFLDLDELDTVFADRWLWSTKGRNLAEFRRSDFLGSPTRPLAQAVRDCAEDATGSRPTGPVRMLAHLRYAGAVFNPVTFYYCYAADAQTLDCVVAEITNTPWRERHAYVVPATSAASTGARFGASTLHGNFPKRFHVSPFMPMDRQYDWRFSTPGERLHVHMDVLRDDQREFDATLTLKRRELNAASLRRVLLRYPLMTAKVVGAIHWQALRLWLKGTPVHTHPQLGTGVR
jgi:uncharacterized protein